MFSAVLIHELTLSDAIAVSAASLASVSSPESRIPDVDSVAAVNSASKPL